MRFLTGMAAAAALLGLVAAAPAEETLTIILVAPQAEAGTLWAAARQGAQAAAEAVGATLQVTPPGSAAAADMAAAIRAAVAARPDGIVASVPDADLLAPALAEAAAAGVPVVTIGEGFDVARALGAALAVGQDDFEAGRAAGEAMRRLGAHSAICLAGAPVGLAQDMRCKGAAEAFDRPAGLLPVAGGADEIEAALGERLEADTAIDAVIDVAGGASGEAALAALAALGRGERVRLAGFDPGPGFLAALAEGRAALAIDQQPFLQGWLAVTLLASQARSGQLPVGDIRTGPRLLDPAAARAMRAAAE